MCLKIHLRFHSALSMPYLLINFPNLRKVVEIQNVYVCLHNKKINFFEMPKNISPYAERVKRIVEANFGWKNNSSYDILKCTYAFYIQRCIWSTKKTLSIAKTIKSASALVRWQLWYFLVGKVKSYGTLRKP